MDLRTYLLEARGRGVQVARALGVNPVLVRQWAASRGVPVEWCAAVEMATGGRVTRRELRPDDWQRIWPEMELFDMWGQGCCHAGTVPAEGAGDAPPEGRQLDLRLTTRRGEPQRAPSLVGLAGLACEVEPERRRCIRRTEDCPASCLGAGASVDAASVPQGPNDQQQPLEVA